jgi:hypothetical protein
MHKPQVIASEHLTVPCILEICLPSSLVDEVNIIMLELVLCGFIVCLDTGADHGDFWGITALAPYTKKKGVSLVTQLEDVRLTHTAHESSSIHLAPCFFKQS